MIQTHKIASAAVPMQEIKLSISDNLNAKKVVIIADACHGAAIGGDFGRRDVISTAMVNNFLKASPIWSLSRY